MFLMNLKIDHPIFHFLNWLLKLLANGSCLDFARMNLMKYSDEEKDIQKLPDISGIIEDIKDMSGLKIIIDLVTPVVAS